MTRPYPFQREDIKRIGDEFNGRVILGHSMGLGKSCISLWYADWYLDHGPWIVICPASLKYNWEREAKKHISLQAEVLSGKRLPPRRQMLKHQQKLYIINYDILDAWYMHLRKLRPTLIILDEIQYIKAKDAKRTRIVRDLCMGVPHVLGLGGTAALENRPVELWPILNILAPEKFDSFFSFAYEYGDPKKKPWGWEYKGASNVQQLHRMLNKHYMIRRRKEDVLDQLPPRIQTIIPVELVHKHRTEYREAVRSFLIWLAKNKGQGTVDKAMKAERLVQMGYLKQLAAQLKIRSINTWIEDFLEEGHDKLLVFGVHKTLLQGLHERFPGSVLVNGSVKGEDRQRRFDQFNKDRKCKLFFGNIDAAGVGWSCTSSNTVLFAELSWTPGKHLQAADRVRGIGRGHQGLATNVFYMVAKDTIEEDLCKLIQKKQKDIDAILDGEDLGTIDIFDMLIDQMKKQEKGLLV